MPTHFFLKGKMRGELVHLHPNKVKDDGEYTSLLLFISAFGETSRGSERSPPSEPDCRVTCCKLRAHLQTICGKPLPVCPHHQVRHHLGRFETIWEAE